MSKNASILFNKITHCGLFKPMAKRSTLSSYDQLLDNMHKWVNSKDMQIINTCTYNPNSSNKEFLETYVAHLSKDNDTGDYFLVLWNRTHESGDSVYALDPTTKTKKITTSSFKSGNLPANHIPGFATYFWIIPSKMSFATITFGTTRTGTPSLQHWINNFYKHESRWAHYNDKDKFIGYKNPNANEDLNTELEPRFKYIRFINPAKYKLITKNFTSIIGTKQKVVLNRKELLDEGCIKSLFNKAGVGTGYTSRDSSVHLTYDIDIIPTKEKIAELILQAEEKDHSWEDIGFKFPKKNNFGADEVEWLGKSYAKTRFEVNAEWIIENQLVDFEDLKLELNNARKRLISQL